MICRHCGDTLPDDAPATATSCKAYCDWLARLRGDMLSASEGGILTLYPFVCALDVAIRDGLEELPDVP
jgi:hypothetical protein